MVIEINIQSLIDGELTPNQFTILKVLFEKKIEIAKTILKAQSYTEDIKVLLTKQYLLKFDREGYLVNTSKCLKLFGLTESSFWELFSSYPMKVPARNGGYRPLRAASPDAKDAEICKKRYDKVIKTKEMHDFVIECLNAELAVRRKTDSMQFMQELSVWLNQRTWEKYSYLLESKASLNEPKHGQDLI